jgi:hypothetical protein
MSVGITQSDSGERHIPITLQVRGAAAQLMGCRDDEVLLVGPAGTGKSRACMIKLHLVALKYPGADILVVRKTASSLSSSFTDEWEDVVATWMTIGEVKFVGHTARKPAQYRYNNGSTVTLGGLDDPKKIMSTQRDMIYVQEATDLTMDDWQALITRNRKGLVPYQQIIADCNPDRPTHWLKKRSDTGLVTMMPSRHRDNPAYYGQDGTPTKRGQDYERKLDKLTGVKRLRLKDGIWAAADGIVYEDWDPAVHVFDRDRAISRGWQAVYGELLPPLDWPRYWVIDWGLTNPFVCQFWAQDPDGRLVLYREVYHTGRIVEDHARQIMNLVTRPTAHLKIETDQRKADQLEPLKAIKAGRRVWVDTRPSRVITDHDAEDRKTFTRHTDLVTTAAKKSVKTGLQATMEWLKIQPDGRARLEILRNCTIERDPALAEQFKPQSTEEEFSGYIWDPAQGGKEKKEAPLKENDHGMDGTRYLVAFKTRSRVIADRDPWA